MLKGSKGLAHRNGQRVQESKESWGRRNQACLHLVFIAVINTRIRSNLGREGVISHYR